jgi:non-homologous end joining protein Ku
MDTLLVQPQNAEQLKTVKTILKALKVDFKAAKKSDSYNPAFVAKIKQSRKQVKEGKVTYIKTKDLWK